MRKLISEMRVLLNLRLPQGISKKRVLLNLAHLYALSFRFNRKAVHDKTIERPVFPIESDVWQSFNHIISVYVRYLAPKYLLKAHIICSAMTGWHFKGFILYTKENFGDKQIAIIPGDIVAKVNNVAKTLTEEFAGLDYDIVNRWLMTYQYAIFNTTKNKALLYEKLTDFQIIELGGGIGANASVNASISNNGVWIYDVPPVLEVQKIVTSKIRTKVKMANISFYEDPEKLMTDAKGKPYIIFSHWAFTEFPMNLRKKLEPLIEGAEFAFFTCNSKFEGIENLAYFHELNSRQHNKMLTSQTVDWVPLKGHNCVLIETANHLGQ